MAKFAIFVLALLTGSISPSPARANSDNPFSPPSLAVSVFNDAGVPQSVLSRAQDRAVQVLLRAGISLVWLDCGVSGHRVLNSGCDAVSYPQHLSVRLLPVSHGLPQDTFGQSFLDASGRGSYANVYVGTMDASKVSKTVDSGDLLGCVIAHELGHLLLGKDSHASIGLMSAKWQFTELQEITSGTLFFSVSQADQILSRYVAATTRTAHRSPPRLARFGR
jgi:hypothetical protein